jgi:thiamine pyrophosphate-dependent acetolactate synthase large subunit-like protein
VIERYLAIQKIFQHVQGPDLVLTTTGMISREAFVTNDRPGNFYMLGSMGLLSSFGLGLTLLRPERRVWVLEGDGSALMSMGTLALIPTERPRNLVHIILDNEAYESTGGQPSISSEVDLAEIARSCGYPGVYYVEDLALLEDVLASCQANSGPHLILVKVSIAPVTGIPRVSHTPVEIRDRFRACVEDVSQS